MTEIIQTHQEGPVLEIIFNRPERLNAMNMEFFSGFKVAMEKAQSQEIRAVLIRGEGKVFSVGGDIKLFSEVIVDHGGVPKEAPDLLHSSIEQMRNLPKPVLAVIHGACAGAGMSLILACDLAIAAESTKFNLAYVGIGISPDGSSTYFLPRHVGLKKAMEIFISGQTMSAQEVLDLGLINRIVPDDEILDQGRQMAQMLSMGPTTAIANLKQLVNRSYDNNLHDQLELESIMFSETSRTKDFQNGVQSFLKKEMPIFEGK